MHLAEKRLPASARVGSGFTAGHKLRPAARRVGGGALERKPGFVPMLRKCPGWRSGQVIENLQDDFPAAAQAEHVVQERDGDGNSLGQTLLHPVSGLAHGD